MAGHSQFKNIMYRKGAQDKKRAKLFTKLAREITVAVKEGGEDPEMNPRLRLAISKARIANMPKDNIERAVSKASGADSDNYENVRYEGYGIAGIAVVVEALTDNRNRTGGSVRAAFTKYGGTLGETGSVTFGFDHLGEIKYPSSAGGEEYMLELAIETGADDCLLEDDFHIIYTSFENLSHVSKSLEEVLGEASSVSPIWKPNVSLELDEDNAQSIMKMISTLEDDDDVQNVYANFEISQEVLEKLSLE